MGGFAGSIHHEDRQQRRPVENLKSLLRLPGLEIIRRVCSKFKG